MSARFLSLVLLASACAASDAVARDDSCTPCNPQGATGTTVPAVGPGLSSLYTDVLGSVKNIHFQKRWADVLMPRANGFCCQATLACVNVENLNVPMCYDKFTTNFGLVDGSSGSLTTGNYTSSDGTKANLLTGDYTESSGQTGNIYGTNASAKPNTATLSIPPQFTGTGVGSAIPITELGSVYVITTTIPGTTITTPTVISASGTNPPQTITKPTTIPAKTSLITTTVSGSASAASPTAKKTGAAAHVKVDATTTFGMSLFTAFMYAIYAL